MFCSAFSMIQIFFFLITLLSVLTPRFHSSVVTDTAAQTTAEALINLESWHDSERSIKSHSVMNEAEQEE